MTAIARRLAICSVALATVALAACSGDPVSPKKVAGPASTDQVTAGSGSRSDTTRSDSTRTLPTGG